MDDLVRWLGEQLDEDERIALAWPEEHRVWEARDTSVETPHSVEWDGVVCVEGGLVYGWERIKVARDPDGSLAAYVAAHDPARVLRDIDAKRRTLVRCQEAMLAANPMLVHFAKQTTWEMARPYADRPGYLEKWRP